MGFCRIKTFKIVSLGGKTYQHSLTNTVQVTAAQRPRFLVKFCYRITLPLSLEIFKNNSTIVFATILF